MPFLDLMLWFLMEVHIIEVETILKSKWMDGSPRCVSVEHLPTVDKTLGWILSTEKSS